MSSLNSTSAMALWLQVISSHTKQCYKSRPVTLFIDDFSVVIQNWWKIHFASPISSVQNFVHDTTSVLSWHVWKLSDLTTISWITTSENSIKLKLQQKNSSWNRPLMFLLIIFYFEKSSVVGLKYEFYQIVFLKFTILSYDEKVYWLLIGNFIQEVVASTLYCILYLSWLIFDMTVIDLIVMDILVSGTHSTKDSRALNPHVLQIYIAVMWKIQIKSVHILHMSW